MTSLIAPCEPPYSAGVTDDLTALMPPGAQPIALFRVLAHNPRILSRFRAGRLLDAGVLSMRERELLILRVSYRCDCDYEWSVHVAGFADAAGLAQADVHATSNRRGSEAATLRSCLRAPPDLPPDRWHGVIRNCARRAAPHGLDAALMRSYLMFMICSFSYVTEHADEPEPEPNLRRRPAPSP